MLMETVTLSTGTMTNEDLFLPNTALWMRRAPIAYSAQTVFGLVCSIALISFFLFFASSSSPFVTCIFTLRPHNHIGMALDIYIALYSIVNIKRIGPTTLIININKLSPKVMSNAAPFSAETYFATQPAPPALDQDIAGVRDFVARQAKSGRKVVLVTVGRPLGSVQSHRFYTQLLRAVGRRCP